MRHQFTTVGLYDGLFVMQDVESLTLWNHMTGEALHGPHVGSALGPVGNLLQVTVDQALAMAPDTRVALSGRVFSVTPSLRPWDELEPMFIETLGDEDARLRRMTLGLALVTDATVRFYPMEAIEKTDTIIDQIDGRSVLVYVDPIGFTPAAVFADVSSASRDGREIRLDGGRVLRAGVLYDAGGTRLEIERPPQLFSRWYGIALTFPDPEIYGQ